MKLKVFHLIPHLKMGGAETLITNYALKINKEKINFVIVTIAGQNGSFNEEKLKNKGIKVIFLGDMVAFPKAKNIFKKIINKIHKYILFYKFVYKEKPNIIHTHLDVNRYLLPINTKRLKIKLFHTLHSEVSVLFGKGRILDKISTRYCIKRKSMILIALHSRMQKDIKDLLNTSSIVLHNGIDIEQFKNVNVDLINKRNSLNINKDAFVIGHVGRFSIAKNHKFLINLFLSVKKELSNAHLLLIGTGELESSIKIQVEELGLSDCVSFLGNRPDIPELMSIMDVFLLPSLYEGLPIVLLEAQAVGVKCVVSNRLPNEVLDSDNIISLGLNEPLQVWCDNIIGNYKKGVIDEEYIDKYDINNILKELEQIYISEKI